MTKSELDCGHQGSKSNYDDVFICMVFGDSSPLPEGTRINLKASSTPTFSSIMKIKATRPRM